MKKTEESTKEAVNVSKTNDRPRPATNAGLRDRILLYLLKNEVESVSALARALDSLRPSVSRAITELQKSEMVAKQGRSCVLTALGETEAKRLEVALPQKAEKVNRLMRSTAQQMRELRNTTAHVSPSEGATDGVIRAGSLRPLTEIQDQMKEVVKDTQRRNFRSSAILVSASDVDDWANRLDARSQLPRLIRRLILATTSDVARLHFEADEGVQLGGWDGIVSSHNGNEFVPAGTSVWEMGVNSDIKGKADDDYEKRSQNSLGLDSTQATFVFVTPRRWSQKDKWEKNRKKEGKWKGVRIYDADDLETWLEEAPAVHLWLSLLLGKHPRGARSLEDFWVDWTAQTEPPFTPDLVIGGRSSAQEKVQQWLKGAAAAFALQGDAHDEPLAFLASVIAAMEEPEREALLARAVVVEDVSSWKELLVSSTNLILIPRWSGEIEGISRAVRNGHHVFVAAEPGSRDVDTLPRLVRDAVEKALQAMGVADERAKDLATLGRRSLWALRRKLASEPLLQTPSWAQPQNARQLLAPLLVSTWQADTPADRKILETLGGVPYEQLQEVLVRWSKTTDPPIRLVGGIWMMVAPEDAWRLLAPFLTGDDLARFKKVAGEVLSTPLELDQTFVRWSNASNGDESTAASNVARGGIASTLALMAALSSEVEFASGASGEDVAHSVVAALLDKAKADATLWASFAPTLMLLAEAAPTPFLEAVDAGLRGEAPLLGQLFQTKDDNYGFGPTSPHTYLLWALETLTWNPDFLGRAALALARLVQLDPGARNGNHPDRSLREIFVLWYPNTTAPLARRLKVLDSLRKRTPDVAWKLFLSLLPTNHGDTVMPTHSPKWHDWEPDQKRPVTYAEIAQATDSLIIWLLADAGANIARWRELLARAGDLWPQHREKLLDALDAFDIASLTPEQRMELTDAIRALVVRHQEFADADWAMPEEQLTRLQNIRSRLEPNDPVLRHLWRFERFVHIAEHRELSWEQRHKEIAQLRVEALQEIVANLSIEGVLRLASQAEDPESVGFALNAMAPPSTDVDAFLAENLASPQGWRNAMALGWIRQRAWANDEAWIQARLDAAQNIWQPEQWGEFFLPFPFNTALLDRLDKLDEVAQRHYWIRTENAALSDEVRDAERVIDGMLAVGRIATTIKLMHWALHENPHLIAPERIMDVLEMAVERPNAQELGAIVYDTAELLDHLWEQNAPRERLAFLEWTFFPLHEHTRTPKVLHDELARDPAFFVEVLCWIYRARPSESETDERDNVEEVESSDEEPKDQEAVELKAERGRRAWSLLFHWHQVPGQQEDETLDEEHLKTWVAQVRELAKERERSVVALIQIGHALAHSPRDADGAWPHQAVRDIIDDIANPRLESGFHCQVMNNRGVTTRGLTDGGSQERVLSGQYDADADQITDAWPRTASVLRGIARNYRHHAEREDRSADLTQDLWS